MMERTIRSKYDTLLRTLKGLEKVVVAFSGGVDSSFLLAATQNALGNNVLAITVETPYIPRWEIKEARSFARGLGIAHRVIKMPFPEALAENPPDRCYRCKLLVFERIKGVALLCGFHNVVEGTNVDDLRDYRPGLLALEELCVLSPLKESGLGKGSIRELSRLLGLPTADKPAFACLLTRLPHGTPITMEELRRIERAETFLHRRGFVGARVRSHGHLARIEVTREQCPRLFDEPIPATIARSLKRLGYRYVTVDLEGYRMGSLNETTKTRKIQ